MTDSSTPNTQCQPTLTTIQTSTVALITHALFLIHPYLVYDCGLCQQDILLLLSTCKYFSEARLRHIGRMNLKIELGSPYIGTLLQSIGPSVKAASLDSTRWIDSVVARVPNPDTYVHRDYDYRKLVGSHSGWLSSLFLWRYPRSQDLIHFVILKRLDIRSADCYVPWKLLVNLEQLKSDVVQFIPECHPPKLRILEVLGCNDDFAEVACCRNLRELKVAVVTKIGPVLNHRRGKDPIGIERLEVQGWSSMNLNSIGSITSLKYLELDAEHATNLSVFWFLRNLKELVLYVQNAFNVSPLQGLQCLESLVLVSDELLDLSPLGHLINLKCLKLGHSSAFDFSPLASLVNLRDIDLQGASNLNYTNFMTEMTQLRTINLCQTRVGTLTQLQNCTQLKSLNLGDTSVSDITALKNLTSLEILDLSNTMVADVTALGALSELKELYVASTLVTSLNPIANSTQLKHLIAFEAMLTNEGVKALVSLKRLSRVILHGNFDFSDLSFLKGHETLTELSISDTAVTDVLPLAEIFSLQILRCERTNIKTLEPLRGIKLQLLDCERSLFETVPNWEGCRYSGDDEME